MTIDNISLDHCCNVVRRDIEEEVKDLRLLFIAHKAEERPQAIEKKKSDIFDLPAAELALDLLRKKENNNDTEFLGLCIEKPSGLSRLFTANRYTAVICINADDYTNIEDITHMLYNQAWHALNMLDNLKSSKDKTKFQNLVIEPKNDRMSLSRNNLMADVFGTIMMQTRGHDDYANLLAKRRSFEALNPILNSMPEYFPFPIVYEACMLIYDDMKDTLDNSNQIVTLIMDMAGEVAMTYDEHSIKQWWSFTRPSQELAWAGYSAEQTLGMALYSSEDPYLRSTAHLVSEIVDIPPHMENNNKIYNPFTADEANDRLHKAKCEQIFQSVISKAAMDSDKTPFLDEARKQNKALLKGGIIGWCAHALLEASHCFDNMTETNLAAEKAKEVFYKEQQKTPWHNLQEANRLIINIRRKSNTIKVSRISDKLQKSEKFVPIAQSLNAFPSINDINFNSTARADHVMDIDFSKLKEPSKQSAKPSPSSEASLSPLGSDLTKMMNIEGINTKH